MSSALSEEISRYKDNAMIKDLTNSKSYNEMKATQNRYMSKHTKFGHEVNDRVQVLLKE